MVTDTAPLDEGPSATGAFPETLNIDVGAFIVAAGFLGDEPCFAAGDGRVHIGARPPVVAHEGALLAAVFDREGGLLTGGDDGRVVRISADGVASEVASAGKRWIDRLAAGPNGAVAFAAGRLVWAIANGRRSEFTEDSAVGALAFAPKGLRLAIARRDGVSMRYIGTDAPAQSLTWKGGHTAVTFSPDGTWLVTGMQEPTLHIWRLSDGMQLRMQGYVSKVRSLSWSVRGRTLATSGAGAALLWPFATKDGPAGKPGFQIARREVLVTTVACHPREDVVAVGYQDGAVMVAIADGTGEIPVRLGPGSQVTSIGWDASGAHFAYGTEGGEAGVFRVF